MADPQLIQWFDKVGAVGLAFIVFALMRGWLVTKREYDREIARGDKLEQRLDRALELGDRALGAGEQIRERLPAKR